MIVGKYAGKELIDLLRTKGYPLKKVERDNGDRPLFYDLPMDHPEWNRCDAWYTPQLCEVHQWMMGLGLHVCVNPVYENGRWWFISSLVTKGGFTLLKHSSDYYRSLEEGMVEVLKVVGK